MTPEIKNLDQSKITIPVGDLIAVTGANGFMGSRICDQLLQLGYRVRGIVRDKKRCTWMTDYMESKHGPDLLDFFEVADMTLERSCDDALLGVSGVIHVAADTSLELNPDIVIPRIIATTMSVCNSAARSPTCKRFVYTSSSSAVAEPQPGVVRTLTSDTFNEEALGLAYSADLPGGIVGGHAVYAAGKTQAEKELWRWYGETRPGFVLNVVIPSPCLGPSLLPERQPPTAANRVLKMLWEGDESDDVVNALTAQWFCDVRDVSALHLGALLLSDIQSDRLFAYGARFTINEILAVFRDASPKNDIRDDVAYVKPDRTEVPNKVAGQILEQLGIVRWTSLSESLQSLISQWDCVVL